MQVYMYVCTYTHECKNSKSKNKIPTTDVYETLD